MLFFTNESALLVWLSHILRALRGEQCATVAFVIAMLAMSGNTERLYPGSLTTFGVLGAVGALVGAGKAAQRPHSSLTVSALNSPVNRRHVYLSPGLDRSALATCPLRQGRLSDARGRPSKLSAGRRAH